MTSQSYLTSFGVEKERKRYKVKFKADGQPITVIGVKACSEDEARAKATDGYTGCEIRDVKVIER